MKHQLAGIVLLSTLQLISAQLYHDYIIAAGAGVQPSVLVADLDSCINLCDAQCSAVSFNKKYGYCVVTNCGNIELQEKEHWVTVTIGNPVLVGESVPLATHEWGLTDRCGVRSVGSFRTPTIIDAGLSYANTNSKLFGNALYFPNKVPTTGTIAKTLPDASISSYGAANLDFALSLFVNFNTLPPNACLFEFFVPDSYAWHFWLWPTIQTPYANLINAAGESQPLQVTNNAGIKAGVWHHIAFSFDASAASLTTYIDGKSIGSQFVASKTKSVADSLIIGGRAKGNLGYFDGSLYCMSVFNQTLTLSEVKELKRACVDGKLRFHN